MNAEYKMKKTRLLRCLFAIALIQFVFGLNEGKYPESLPTVNEVPDCPRNKEDWQVAAEGKHSDQIKNIDNTPFVYHCLINAWANATIEVCAPTWYISGYCAMYSIPDARVIDNEKYDCTKYTPPCPTRYLSSEAYKYSVCYEIVRPAVTLFMTQVSKAEEISTQSTEEVTPTAKFTSVHLILTIIIPAILLLALFGGFVFLRRIISVKRESRENDMHVDNNEMENEPLNAATPEVTYADDVNVDNKRVKSETPEAITPGDCPHETEDERKRHYTVAGIIKKYQQNQNNDKVN